MYLNTYVKFENAKDHKMYTIWKNIQNVKITVLPVIFDKWNNFLSKFYFFNCILENMKLYKNSQFSYYDIWIGVAKNLL